MVNKVILVGNVGSDPELKQTAAGQSVVNISMATTYHYKDKNGEMQNKTDWHKVVAWGTTAESVNKYVNAGTMISVIGRITYEQYEKNGEKRYYTSIIAEDIKFLSNIRSLKESKEKKERPINLGIPNEEANRLNLEFRDTEKVEDNIETDLPF